MRGRKSAPTPLKILRGEQKSRVNHDEPAALPGDLVRPDHLDEVARSEWDRIVPEIKATGVLSRVDAPTLAIYCVVYSRWLKARESMTLKGLVISTDLGGVKPNPAATIAAVCEATMHRLLAEFGCTPAARTRIKIGGEKPKDRLGEFLDRKRRG